MEPNQCTESDTDAESIPKKQRINYICDWHNCIKGFRRENSFDRHYFTHTGIKKYTCDVEGCLKSYTIRDHLKRHTRITHETILSEEILCSEPNCGMIFTNRSNMVRHVRRRHENPRIFKCSDCSETFRRKDQLRKHRMDHTGQFPHICETCGKGFVNLKTLRSHLVCHRLLKCSQCDKEVPNWTELVAHRKKEHRSVFKCSSCDRQFHSKSRLRSHEVIHKAREERPNFICDFCGREYTRKSNLLAHIRSAHENQRYSCTSCNAALSTKKKLQLHMTSKHSENPREARSIPQRPRNRRKDAGKPRVSMASVLSGISAPREVEEILLRNDGAILQVEYSPVYKSGSATDTESEKNFAISGVSGVKVTVKGHI
ncbi:zinc finger protein 665 [Phlebotomus papatasi]|uniref:zinc finger protein 665 n=1 Tax=Phlebotomus papatasi TaxID=29031 RepID=UPI00248426D0|nr:zinc finger protein 665 [Phlebotomus papatasi]